MNISIYCSPIKTAQALQKGVVSTKVILLSKDMAVLSFGVIVLSLFLQPATTNFFQTFGDIFFLIVYLGTPLVVARKYHIKKNHIIELLALINLVSMIRMVIASFVLILFGIIVLIPNGYHNTSFLLVGDLFVWCVGIYTMYVGVKSAAPGMVAGECRL